MASFMLLPVLASTVAVIESDQDSRSSSRARLIQVRHDLGRKDANRRSARLPKIDDSRARKTIVLNTQILSEARDRHNHTPRFHRMLDQLMGACYLIQGNNLCDVESLPSCL